MKKLWLLVPALAFTLIACNQPSNPPKTNTRTAEDVDNTGQNVRDSDFNTITPGDQSASRADLTITQDIRKAVVANSSLSTDAKNIKIMTINGVVTLRGPVATSQEKTWIENKAKSISGVNRVNSQIEVATNR